MAVLGLANRSAWDTLQCRQAMRGSSIWQPVPTSFDEVVKAAIIPPLCPTHPTCMRSTHSHTHTPAHPLTHLQGQVFVDALL